MANKIYEEQSIQNIANAIRAKSGSVDTYTVGDMAAAIEAMPSSGGGVELLAEFIDSDCSYPAFVNGWQYSTTNPIS